MADTAKLTILALGAHPDDCDIKAAGVAAKYARAGHRVVFVSLTNGVTGHHETGGIELARRRKLEGEAAAKVAGIEFQVLDIASGELMPDLTTRRRIIQMLREIQPDLVMSHRPNDYHPDHRAAAQLVQDACYLATVPNNVPLTPALREMPVVVYFHDHFQRPYPFHADVAVSIDDVIDTKIDMMHCHTSQMYEWLPYNTGILDEVPTGVNDRRDWLAAQRKPHSLQVACETRSVLERLYGTSKGEAVKYAEAFEACEYGKRLTPELIGRLFPFFPDSP
jgi:LmbE family N-acetylglucosaminyl deacetylase